MHQALDATIHSKAKVVVISSTWDSPNPNEVILLKDGSVSTFEKAFEKTVHAIMDAGKKIVFLIDTPRMPNEMENCMGLRPIHLVKGACSIPQNAYLKQVQGQMKYFGQWAARYPNDIFVIDSGSALCDGMVCHMLSPDGKPLYADRDHLTDLGGSYIAKDVWRKLEKIMPPSPNSSAR